MDKKMNYVLIFVSFLISFFALMQNTQAYQCKYYKGTAFEDDGSLKSGQKPLIIEFRPNKIVADINNIAHDSSDAQAVLDWTNSYDYFHSKCDKTWRPDNKQDGGYITSYSCLEEDPNQDDWYRGGNLIVWHPNSHVVYQEIYVADDTIDDMIYEDGACPDRIVEYENSNWNILNVGVQFYTYGFDDILTNYLGKKLSFFSQYGNGLIFRAETQRTLYTEESKGPDFAGPGTCVTYNYYMRALQNAKDETGTCENNHTFSKKYQKLSDICNAYRSSSLEYTISNKNNSNNDDNNDNVVRARACMTACSALRDDVAFICKGDTKQYSCQSLGAKIIDWLYKIIRIVRYGVPIMLIILSVMDFIRAMAADSEDEMKKATSRFGKRLIAAALVFLVPFVLDFILGMFNLPNLNDPFCTG